MLSDAFEVYRLFTFILFYLTELAFAVFVYLSFLPPVTFWLLSAYPAFKSLWARKINEQAYA